MYQSQTEAKAFTIAYRARFEPEVHFRSYFTRCTTARFWRAVEAAYDKFVSQGDWYEGEFEWAVSYLLRHSAPVTSRNLQKAFAAYLAQAAPVQGAAQPLVTSRERAAVRSLVSDFHTLGAVSELAK